MSNATKFNQGDTIELDQKYYTVKGASIDEFGHRYRLNEHRTRKEIQLKMQYVDDHAEYIQFAEPHSDTGRTPPHTFYPDDIIEFPSGSKEYFTIRGVNVENKRYRLNYKRDYIGEFPISIIDKYAKLIPMPETHRTTYKRSRAHSPQRGGKRRTRRNKLRKKRRKTNRRR